MRKILNRKSWPLILCFLAPMFIMACYFAYRNMSPFGRQSILTVDLGQQYVDLFAYFKHVLLNHPGGLFYSFSKAFGGEMLGTWAYYLMSPLNLILLIIPLNYLPAGVLLIILLKYGLSGLSLGYLLSKTIKPSPYLTIMWSIIYALNGWIIANQINVMWLDAMIWLPLIILGINRIFSTDHAQLFIVALSGAIITNYYMGYMLTLFTFVYLFFKFIATSLTFKQCKRIAKKLIESLLTCLGLCAWLVLPTWYSLTQGKARYSSPTFQNHFEYDPFRMFSKLFNGSLNFDQLPSGTPNLFIGSIALIGFLIYLLNRRIPLRKRGGVLVVTLFLIISMAYQPLDLLWHAGQFPIWYPYRFSYLFCFWIIWIAANALNYSYHTDWQTQLIIAIILSSLMIYVFMNRISFSFISPLHFILGVMFLLIGYILLLYTHNDSKIFAIALLCFSTIEMSVNAGNSLNNLTYLSNKSYVHTTRQLSSLVSKLPHHKTSRIGKSYYRSKNDPLNNHYLDGNVFDSSLESTTPRFMERIGQPAGHGFVTYTNGTLLSDRLLDFRYFLTNNRSHNLKPIFYRPDLNNYVTIHHSKSVKTYQNRNAMPMTFTTYPSSLHIKGSNNPVIYQERWYHAITKQSNVKFKKDHFNSVKLINLKRHAGQLHTLDPLKTGMITCRLKPKPDTVYYLLIRPNVNPKTMNATLNHHRFLPNTAYNTPLVLSLNSGQNQKSIKLNFKLMKTVTNENNFKLYQLKTQPLLQHPYAAHSKITHFSSHRITGHFTATHSRSILGTSLPATHGWHLKIDGRPQPIKSIAHEFIGASANPGRHTFTLTYVPPYLIMGLIITALTAIGLILSFLL